jgi:hypothetical protein
VSTTFEVQQGLPPYGPLPYQFSPNDHGAHWEGLVVQFKVEGELWVGNFQRGGTQFDAAITHPDGRLVIIVAGGQGYMIDPSARSRLAIFGGDITGEIRNGTEQIIFSTFTDVRIFGPARQERRSRRLSWDGLRLLRVEGGLLHGEGWTLDGDRWVEFMVDLATGEASGGAYPSTSAE